MVGWLRGLETLIALGGGLLSLVTLGRALLSWVTLRGWLLILLSGGRLETSPAWDWSWGRFRSCSAEYWVGDGILASRGDSRLGCLRTGYHHWWWVVPTSTTRSCWSESWPRLVWHMSLGRGQTRGGLVVSRRGVRSEHGGLCGGGVRVVVRLLWLHELRWLAVWLRRLHVPILALWASSSNRGVQSTITAK